MSEYWDIYDENRVKTNRTIKRGDPFAEGEYYVCCEIWIMDVSSEMELNELINDGVFVNSVAGRYEMYKDKIKWEK